MRTSDWNVRARVAMVAAVVALAASTSTGCTSSRDKGAGVANGDDPIAALASDVHSTRYGNPFWLVQSDSNTQLWQRAKSYCRANAVTPAGQKINCASVMAVAGTELIRYPSRRTHGAPRL